MIHQLRRYVEQRLAGSALLRNSLTLVSGSLASQAILFLASPILSRVFSAEDFGDLANFTAWTAILALVSNLRYEHAVIVGKSDEQTHGVIALAGLLSIISTMIVAGLSLALHLYYDGGGYLGELQRIALFVPLGMFSIAASSLLNQHLVKRGEFARITGVAILQVAVTVSTQVTLGILGVDHALIIGTIGGFAAAFVLLALDYYSSFGFGALKIHLNVQRLKHYAEEYQNFPRFAMAADGIAVLSQRFLPVLVLAWFGIAVAGLYAFAVRAVRMPLIMLAHPVTSALRKEGIDAVLAGRSLVPLFVKTTRALLVVAIVPFLVLAFYSEPLFLFVFGSQWGTAGRIVEILSPGMFFEFLAIPSAVFFLVTETQHLTLVVQACGFLALVFALAVGDYLFADFIPTSYILSAVMIAVNSAALWLAYRVSRSPPTLQQRSPEPESMQ